jgi:hypothetical protein
VAEHLFDHVRPVLAAPLTERIAFIRAPRWIGTDAALAAHRGASRNRWSDRRCCARTG